MKTGANKPKIVVGMSGGVDSSVTAALLKEQGYFVVGVFMKFWKDGKSGQNRCCSVESEKLARLVAKKIGIPFYVLNVEKEFKKEVVDYFLKEYKKGTTPNPCVVCNKEIKFGYLIKKALSLGADYVATGHYARISSASLRGASEASNEAILHSVIPGLPPRMASLASGGTRNPRRRSVWIPAFPPRLAVSARLGAGMTTDFRLQKGADNEKDQSYFLCQLNQKQLEHVLFPLGGYKKEEVRKLAKKFDLPTAETPESQEVCFIQNTTDEFLKKYLKAKPGNIVKAAPQGGASLAPLGRGKVVGQHNGLWFYTIGQRRGIGLSGGPFYVVGKDLKRNVLIVSTNQKDLLSKELLAKNVNWIGGNPPQFPAKIKAKVRYRHESANAVIEKAKGKTYKVKFSKPQRAITPGQSVVFYRGTELLGGGVII
jgi:tRNA-specific 2-thiouridylase